MGTLGPMTPAGDAFFAAAEASGNISVKLYPTEDVDTGVSTLVTFGMPFPRGSITSAGLANVRVLKGGSEITAYVAQLTPWRHTTNAAIDGQSVRVARIQISNTFAVSYPNYETITVEWGQNARTLDDASYTDERTAWHEVTTGSFDTSENVYEPDVYAVLPKAHMCKGGFHSCQMLPMDDSVAEARMDPYDVSGEYDGPGNVPGTDYGGYLNMEHAAVNNFYSAINQDDPLATDVATWCKYKIADYPAEDGEAWLYDRSSAFFILYFRSGYFKILREAVRATEYYRMNLQTGADLYPGGFEGKDPPDVKYSYNQCLAYQHWTVGDEDVLPHIPEVAEAYPDWGLVTFAWDVDLNFWTERHVGFGLGARLVAYEIEGGTTHKNALTAIIDAFVTNQDGTAQIAAGMAAPTYDGAMYHLGAQHSYDWSGTAYGASPWMSSLVADAMARCYSCTESEDVANFLRRLGNFTMNAMYSYSGAAALYYGDPYYGATYSVLVNGTRDPTESSEEHNLDCSSAIGWGVFFAEQLGYDASTLRTRILGSAGLLYGYKWGIWYWCRPDAPSSAGYTAFRIGPSRKYGWEFRDSGSLSWCLEE